MEIKYNENNDDPRFSIENLTISEMYSMVPLFDILLKKYQLYKHFSHYDQNDKEKLKTFISDEIYLSLGKDYFEELNAFSTFEQYPYDFSFEQFLLEFLDKQETAVRYLEYKSNNQSNK